MLVSRKTFDNTSFNALRKMHLENRVCVATLIGDHVFVAK